MSAEDSKPKMLECEKTLRSDNPTYEQLLENNRKWAAGQKPIFFARLRAVQEPDFLWIGCSDSRVPSNMVTGTTSGQIFVHRNVANLVIPTDFNLLCVLHYAVEYLHVKHVIVCGHYGCGGIHAAMSKLDHGPLLNGWLNAIKDVYTLHRAEMDEIADPAAREARLTELNVQEQVRHLAQTSIVQRHWKRNSSSPLFLHGWVYSLDNGVVNPLVDMGPGSKKGSIHEYHL